MRTTTKVKTWVAAGLMGLAIAGAGVTGAGAALAAGKPAPAPVPGAPAAAPCGTVTVLNNGEQIARSLVPPDVRYSVASCGTAALDATVTISEAPGRMSDTCPSPTAGPIPVALAAGARTSTTASVFRASCGFAGGAAGAVAAGSHHWQDHVLALTLTDNASGAVLASSSFFWQDAPFTHP